jgi:ATP-binding protein involved in chromosome partitioning
MLGISGMFRFNEQEIALAPHDYSDHVKVVSIECLLDDLDSAVIWPGPVKHGVIKQFISEVD